MRGLRWALLATLCVGGARAEPDVADYKVDPGVTAGRARERLGSEIARDIEQEARRARLEAERQAQQRAQAEAEEARRPYPQRLLKARCTLCHPADHYLHQRHTVIGWHGVILRMRWLNGAPIALDEHAVLAGELARVRPAQGTDALVEHGLVATASTLLLAVPLLAGWASNRRRRRRA